MRSAGPPGPAEPRSTELSDSALTSLRLVARGAGAIVAGVGCAILLGWLLQLPALRSLIPGVVSMKANTALAFVFGGAALWLAAEPSKRAVPRAQLPCAAMAALIGLLTLSEYLLGVNLGIDQLLVQEAQGILGIPQPGRMAPSSAASFLFLGAALLLIDREAADQPPSQLLTVPPLMVSLLVLMGYAYGVDARPSLSPYTLMSVQTAVLLVVLCLGILLARPERGLMSLLLNRGYPGIIARRLLLSVTVLPIALGWLTQLGQRANLFGREFSLWVTVGTSMLVLAAMIWWAAGSLARAEEQRRVSESERERLFEAIRAAVARLSATSPQILASTNQQATSATEQASAIQQTSTTAHRLKQTAELTRERAHAVLEAARGAAIAAEEGRQAAEENVDGIRDSRDRAKAAAERVLTLAERGQAIGEVLAVVDEIAEQSNLLAVNAAIEAARAGEVGKSFAVVATEVKALAEQSRAATAQVRTMLFEIQQASQAAVLATEQGIRMSEARQALARRLEEIVHLLADNLNQAAQAAQQIEAAAIQQVEAIDHVALAMREIDLASGQNTASAHQVERAAEDMHELSVRLSGLVTQPAPMQQPKGAPS